MKKTLITIALTTLVIFSLIGVTIFVFANNYGMGGGAATEEVYFDRGISPSVGGIAPAAAPMEPMPSGDMMVSDSASIEFAAEESRAANQAVQTERLVIQNVDMSIVVPDPKASMSEISDMAVEMGGYVVSSNIFQSTYGPNQIEVPEGSITIRVPSERLDEALGLVKEKAVDVNYENRSGQDVTNQYVDLKSRLKAKQDAEKKLTEIMQDAIDSEDVLAIYNQIQNIQTEIEVLKGQIKYYEESAALSAISIRLIAEETVQPIEIGSWKLQGTANDAVEDLINFTQGFTRFLIRFVLYTLPSLILIAIPLYLVFIGGRGLFRRFRKEKPMEVETKKEEKKKK